MANKKFLDFEGVRHLWSKINMQDYPNNDMLMDIIQAIDETKADKTDLIQSDWNQEDEFALDYIKNRTHYDSRTDGEVNITYNGELTGYEVKQLSSTEHLVKVSNLAATEDQLISAAIAFLGADSLEHYSVEASDLTHDNGNIYVRDCILIVPGDTTEFSKGTWFKRVEDPIAGATYPKTFAYAGTIGGLKKLDSKYLPDTVLLTEEQLLTAEQREQVRTNIDRYTWKTFRDNYGSYTYTIDKMPYLDFDKAQTVANVSGDGNASALEALVSWASTATIFYSKASEALNLVKNTVANYEALFENGAITASLSLLLQTSSVVRPDDYYFVGIQRIAHNGATHVFQASTLDHTLTAYYNINEQTITSFSSKYIGVDSSLSFAGKSADAKIVGDRFEQLKDSIDLLNNRTKKADKVVIVDSGNPVYIPVSGTDVTVVSGDVVYESGNIIFTPGRFLDYVEHVSLNVDGKSYTVDIVPAPMMYYETDFADGIFEFVQSDAEDAVPWHIVTDGEDNTPSYISGGSSYYVEGKGLSNTFTTFSFTGTGFDVVSRCGLEQGIVKCIVASDPEFTQQVASSSALHKCDMELYPVVTVGLHDLPHGKYYAKICIDVPYTNTTGNPLFDRLNRGSEFYFDAIIIHDPINVLDIHSEDSILTQEAYSKSGKTGLVCTRFSASSPAYVSGESASNLELTSVYTLGAATIVLPIIEDYSGIGATVIKVPVDSNIHLMLHSLNGESTVRINRHDIDIRNSMPEFYNVSRYIDNGYLALQNLGVHPVAVSYIQFEEGTEFSKVTEADFENIYNLCMPPAIQADWSQTDATAVDFIKNKPDERTAVEIVMATGLVSPVAGDTNVVYTDENNNVYIF